MNPMRLAWIILFGALVAVTRAESTVSTPIETITNTNCSAVRRESYRARLDIVYVYLLEWNASVALDLEGVGRAIASGLVDMLDECDSLGQPMFAVQISKDAVVSREGICSSLRDDNASQCRVLRGATSILLDEDTDRVEQLAYFVIGRALNEPELLQGYTEMQIHRTELLQPISDNLVVLKTTNPSYGGPGEVIPTGATTIVKSALAAAAISFLFTVGFAYVMYSRRKATTLAGADGKSRIFQLHTKHRQFFQELHDEESNAGLEPGWMVTDSDLRSPSITWSVSDLTTDSIDDSQSIRSTLPLDRIIEALSEEELPSGDCADLNTTGRETFDDPTFVPHWSDIESAHTGSSYEEYHTPRQYRTPPHQLPFRPRTGVAKDVSLSISPVTPPSYEMAGQERTTSHDLDSITISLEGCQYLEHDVETSDELECSFSSDLANRLDILGSSFAPHDARNDGMVILSADDNLLFSDDDMDMPALGEDAFERAGSRSDGDIMPKHAVVVETVLSDCSSDDECSLPTPSVLQTIQERLYKARTQLLLTYSS